MLHLLDVVADDHTQHAAEAGGGSSQQLLEEAFDSFGGLLLGQQFLDAFSEGGDEGPGGDGEVGEDVEGDAFDWVGKLLPGVAHYFGFVQVYAGLDRKLPGLDLQLHHNLGKHQLRDEKFILPDL